MPSCCAFQHDRRAVGVVGTDKVDVMAAHSLVPYPDISLDMLQHVTEVDGAVGVRQGAGYQYFFATWAIVINTVFRS
jgi:hypothetical protein